MCTVIFIPDNKKIFLASLRDESPKRLQAVAPDVTMVNGVKVLSPKDTLAGGTWIGTNSLANVIILLNGGFDNHTRNNYYRKSRGLIVTELLATEFPVFEWSKTDMTDIEPFTLIAWSKGDLFQLVWDGSKKNSIHLDATVPHIWSSATLYNLPVSLHRKNLFQHWIAEKPAISKLTILDFFNSFIDAQNGFIMNRNEKIKTLSYTFLEINNQTSSMSYIDFLSGNSIERSISFTSMEEDHTSENKVEVISA